MLPAAATISFLVVCYYAFVRRRTFLLDPFTIFFFSMSIYMLYIPLVMKITGDYDVVIELTDIVIRVNDADWYRVTLLGCIALACGSITYQTLAKYLIWPSLKNEIDGIDNHATHFDRDGLTLVLTTACFVLVLVTTQYGNLIASTESYEASYSITYQNPVFSFLRSIATFSLGTLVNYFILTQRRYLRVFISSSALFLVLSILMWTKLFLVMVVLSGFCLSYRLGLRSKTLFLIFFLMAAAVGFGIVLPAYGIYRGGGEVTWDMLTTNGAQEFYSDPVGPFAATMYILQSTNLDSLSHAVTTSPLWSSFFLWIPRAIWPDRPLDMSEAFARYVFTNWEPGRGMGFSPFVEGILRFGDWGAAIIPALTAFVAALLLAGFIALYPRSIRISLLTSIGALVLFYTQRGPFSGLLTFTLQFFLPHAIVFKSTQLATRFVYGQRFRPATAPLES